MERLTAGLFGGLIVLAAPTLARSQTIDAGPVQVEVTGYAQIQWNTTSVDEDDLGFIDAADGDIAWSTFETRRIRPTIAVVIDEWIEGKIQPDFALGDLDLEDAYMDFAIDDAFHLTVGQFKKPFSRIELTSSSRILPIERGVRIRGLIDALTFELDPDPIPIFTDFDGDLIPGEEYEMLDELGYLGRDLGLAAHGTLGRVGYAVGVFNGDGADQLDDNDGKSVAGRLDFAPIEDRPLVIGAAGSYRELFFDGEFLGVDIDRQLDGFAFEVDAEWGAFRREGLHALVEGVIGDNFVGGIDDDGPILLPEDATLLGVQGIVTWFEPTGRDRLEGIEPLLRVSYGDPSTDRADDAGLLLTPGVNLYFFGRNRIMFNWDVFLPGGEAFDTEHALRAQAQLHY